MKICPIDGCKAPRGDLQVMCRTHWYMASNESRDLIWRAYHKRRGSATHRAAVFAAILEVQEKVNQKVHASRATDEPQEAAKGAAESP